MGDSFKKVQAGQPLQLPAALVNATIDTILWAKGQQQSTRPGQGRRKLQAGQLLIHNTSGGNLEQFAVLGISNALIDPADNPEGFTEIAAAVGVEPTADHVGGRFAVLLEPVADDEVGLAIAAGVTPLKINVSSEDHWFADVEPGTSTELVSTSSGPVQILWKQSGTGAGKFALARFGGGGGKDHKWGKLVAPWAPGNETVTLQPVQDETGTPFDEPPDPVAVRIIMPMGRAPAYLVGEVNDVFEYVDRGSYYRLENPQTTPIPARKWEVMQAVNDTGDPAEWACDYMRGHEEE